MKLLHKVNQGYTAKTEKMSRVLFLLRALLHSYFLLPPGTCDSDNTPVFLVSHVIFICVCSGAIYFYLFFNLMLLISFRLFMQPRKHGMGHDMEEEETTTMHVSIPQAHTCIDSLSFAKGFKQLFVQLKCSSVLLLS